MFAVMIPATVAMSGSTWMLTGLCLAVLFFGTVTAPQHVRKLATAMALAVVLAVGLTKIVPSIIIQCGTWNTWPWC